MFFAKILSDKKLHFTENMYIESCLVDITNSLHKNLKLLLVLGGGFVGSWMQCLVIYLIYIGKLGNRRLHKESICTRQKAFLFLQVVAYSEMVIAQRASCPPLKPRPCLPSVEFT